MDTGSNGIQFSRRSTVAALTSGGIGFAMLAGRSPASAQVAQVDYSDHPLCGMWLALANPQIPDDPQVYVPSLFTADGIVLLAFPISLRGRDGVDFISPTLGVWEPYDEQTGHFTVVQSVTDIDGNVRSVVTIDGHPQVSDDGETFVDDGSLVTVTVRDAAGGVLAVVPPATPSRSVTAVRMAVGLSGFPGNAPGDGTPVG